MKMKNLLFIILGIIIVPVIAVICLTSRNLDADIKRIDLSKVDNLMIVAHPDDELLWGGAHLIRDNYLVVCITCGTNATRDNEIRAVLDETGDELLKLGYPDKVFGKRSDWKNDKEKIFEDLKKIISLKKWNSIVTHNLEGEYGHEHHIMTHQITTDAYNDLGIKTDLYFFGKYYSKKKIAKLMELPERIPEKELKKKKELIELYKSQSFIKTTFDHMFEYEDWTKQ